MVFQFSLSIIEGTIRSARDSDIPVLEWHGGPDLRSFYQACWKAHLNGDSTLLIADWNDYPVGQVVIVWGGKANHPHFPDLQSLRVHPAFRGQKIGTLLIEAAEKLIEERGHHRIGLSVGVDNPHAQRLYERLGYSRLGEVYEDCWSYYDSSGKEIIQTERVIDLVKDF
jgi:ribosomal protein S18 acetylase RimI-like enzyme